MTLPHWQPLQQEEAERLGREAYELSKKRPPWLNQFDDPIEVVLGIKYDEDRFPADERYLQVKRVWQRLYDESDRPKRTRPDRRAKLPDELPKDEIVAKYQDGESLRALGGQYGVSHKSIARCLRIWGVEIDGRRRKPVLPNEDIQRAVRYMANREES